MIKNLIIETVATNQDSVSPMLLWDTIKCVIRGATIKYSAHRKTLQKARERKLEREISETEHLITTNHSQELLSRLKSLKYKYDTLSENKLHSSRIFKRYNWVLKGEKIFF